MYDHHLTRGNQRKHDRFNGLGTIFDRANTTWSEKDRGSPINRPTRRPGQRNHTPSPHHGPAPGSVRPPAGRIRTQARTWRVPTRAGERATGNIPSRKAVSPTRVLPRACGKGRSPRAQRCARAGLRARAGSDGRRKTEKIECSRGGGWWQAQQTNMRMNRKAAYPCCG